MARPVLKGGISYNRYVWHTDDGACDECQALDGMEFDYVEDIPDRPHPNCKCWVEVIENGDYEGDGDGAGNGTGNPKPKEEPCDCWTQIENLCSEVEELDGELSGDIEEAEEIVTDIENEYEAIVNFQSELKDMADSIISCGDECVVTGYAANISNDDKLEDAVYNIVKHIEPAREAYEKFLENKEAMEAAQDGLDKYYHAKANCEAAELGMFQEMAAAAFSVAKEVKDAYAKIIENHQNVTVVLKDCWMDLKADWYGLEKAKEHGECKDKVKDAPEIFRDFSF